MKKNLLLLLTATSFFANAQNNPIFNGGSADGFDKGGFAQAANAIFRGGDQDGWHFAAFAPSANAIFLGGMADGWSWAAYVGMANNIFSGGSADGWANASFLQPGNSLFGGGDGDGCSYQAFLQGGNNIYSGGQSDGWASTYRPLGVLPLVLTSFTAEKQNTKVHLHWETIQELNTAYFEVERSADARYFNRIGRVTAAGNSGVPQLYSYWDDHPLPGLNYYRLKQVDQDGTQLYTAIKMVLFSTAGINELKVYPIPAHQTLTVNLPAIVQGQEVFIRLSNALGVRVLQQKIPAERSRHPLQLVLPPLPAGIYTLQLSAVNYSGSQVIIKQ